MVPPRADIVWGDVARPVEESLLPMAESDHARFPVCRGGFDDVLGIVAAKQMFNQIPRGDPADSTERLRAPVYVPESLTSEFQPKNREDAWAVQREDGSWLLDGLIPLPERKDRLGLSSAPKEDEERCHMLSGMVMPLLGRLPETGDATPWEGWNFAVVDLDGKRIDKAPAGETENGEG